MGGKVTCHCLHPEARWRFFLVASFLTLALPRTSADLRSARGAEEATAGRGGKRERRCDAA